MIKLTTKKMVQYCCQLSGKWAVYLSMPDYPCRQLIKAANFLSLKDDYQAMHDGEMIVMCDSERECEEVFSRVVGRDGPTVLNKYNGECRIYALTCNPDGQFMNENT